MVTIVGRESELERLAAFVAAVPSAPGALLVEGEAGIGKTTLWWAAIEDATAREHRVLTTVAAASEAQLSFTGVRDLLGAAFGEVAHELPPPQRRALAATLLLEDGEPEAAAPTTIAVAVLSALQALAERRPTLVAVDDAQWLDAASAAVLAYTLRRLDRVPVAVLLARREGETGALEVPDDVERLRPAPLSAGALGRIIHAELGYVYPRPTLLRLREISGGNSFYALELARALGQAPKPLLPGDPLPVPASLRELVRERIAGLPAGTLEALSFAAAAGATRLELLAAALERDPSPLLEPARRAGLVLVDETVRFAHPLHAGAVAEITGPALRRAAHAALARHASDVEERARHLALATDARDEGAAAAIEAGARAAFARGSPADAAALAARSRALATSNSHAAAISSAEADYAFAAGDTARANSLLDELASSHEPGPERARLLARQARVRHFAHDIDGSVDLLRRALAEAGDDDTLQGEIEEGLAWGLVLLRRDLDAAAAHAASAARRADARGDRAARAEGLAAEAVTALVRGRPWRPAIERALEDEDATLGLRVLRHPSFALGYCLGCADESDEARAVFASLVARAEAAGDESSLPSLFNHLTLVECLAGRWDEAERLADEGLDRARESGQLPTQVSILAKQALVRGRRGEHEESRELALRALELADVGTASPEAAIARGGETAVWALGYAELASGRADEAARLLVPLARTLVAAGVREPGEVRCLPDAVESAIATGRLDDADELLAAWEQWSAALARPTAAAAGRRCRGLLLAARGETEGAVEVLEASAEERSLPFEHGRALVALGAQQRRLRRRRAARETLERAALLFDELGAAAWSSRARDELGRIGGRSASPAELTPTERRVAELVADGSTNREVAAALVVTVHTVEAALTSIYRKLDVRSRTEMARKLARKD